ncbi:MAG: hypothetical protein IK065_06840, partial [Neisseriaceae bacterium]|nr:hypothetical protein [Neisseriaceae bacterium]
MNKIYRTVYNESTNTWIAVEETAKSHRKSASGVVDCISHELSGRLQTPVIHTPYLDRIMAIYANSLAAQQIVQTSQIHHHAANDNTYSKFRYAGIAASVIVAISLMSPLIADKAHAAPWNDGSYARAMGENAQAWGESTQASGALSYDKPVTNTYTLYYYTAGDESSIGYFAPRSSCGSGLGFYYLSGDTLCTNTAVQSRREIESQFYVYNDQSDPSSGQKTHDVISYVTTDVSATGKNATAFGLDSKALGDQATAWGKNTTSGGIATVATLYSRDSDGLLRYVIEGAGNGCGANQAQFFDTDGNFLQCANNDPTSPNYYKKFVGSVVDDNYAILTENTTAFGRDTVASANQATAFGQETQATGQNSTAFGRATTASGEQSTAWGQGTKATHDNATAFGFHTEALENNATAWGHETHATERRSTAFGMGTTASGRQATAFGYSTTASGENSTAFGSTTTASGGGSLAFGFNTKAGGENSVAWGDGSKVINYLEGYGEVEVLLSTEGRPLGERGKYYVVDGTGNPISGVGSFESRTDANTWIQNKNGGVLPGQSSTAFGNNSTVKANNALGALGGTVEMSANNSAAIGVGSLVEAENSYAIGNKAQISDTASSGSVALGGLEGNNTQINKAQNAFATTGGTINSGANYAIAMGGTVDGGKINAVAIGKGSNAKHQDSVALGSNSVTKDGTIATKAKADGASMLELNGANYTNHDWANHLADIDYVVSVGNRQIQNVAAGRVSADSDDAINGSQLYAAYQDLQWQANASDDGGEFSGSITTPVIGDYENSANKGKVNYIAGSGIKITASENDALNLKFEVRKDIDPTHTAGKVNNPSDADKYWDSKQVTNAINDSGWIGAGGQGGTTELINPSDTVTFNGKNGIKVTASGTQIDIEDLNKVTKGNNITVESQAITGGGTNYVVHGMDTKVTATGKGISIDPADPDDKGVRNYVVNSTIDGDNKYITVSDTGIISFDESKLPADSDTITEVTTSDSNVVLTSDTSGNPHVYDIAINPNLNVT